MSTTVSPASARFGPVPAGSSDVKLLLVQNQGAAVTASIDGAGFSILTDATVAAGSDQDLYVEYAGPAVGTHTATLRIERGGTEVATATLTGTTTASLSIAPSSLAFGDVIVGNTSVVPVMVTNNTGATVTLSLASAVGGAFTFAPSEVESTGIATQVLVRLTPSAPGAVSATLRVGSAADAPACALSGTGVAEQDSAALVVGGAAQAAADAAQATADANAEELEYVDSSSAAGATRFKVEVPYGSSRLYVGRGVANSSFEATIDGCGLDTDDNVYLHARSDSLFAKAGSNVLLWADGGAKNDGFAWMHNAGSDGSAVVSSAGSTYVSGDGGVIINGGLPLNVDGSGTSTAPNTDVIDAMAVTFTALDIAVGSKLCYDAGKSFLHDFKTTSKKKRLIEGFGTLVALGAPVVGMLGAGGVLPGATIFGLAGVSIFSPAYTAIYGIGGIGLVSMFPTMFGLVDSTIWAGDDVNVNGVTGSVNLNAGSEINLHAAASSGGAISITASANHHAVGGTVSVGAKTIGLGSKVLIPGSGGAPLTDAINLEATKIAGEALTELTLKVGAAELTMKVDGSITLKGGANEITLTPAGGIAVNGSKVELKAQSAAVALDPSGAVLKYGSGDVVKAAATGVTLQHGVSKKLAISDAGLDYTGPMHKVG